MDREKAPESENFQTLFLQMGNQITHDPGGHAPDGVAPVEPHRDLYLAAVPRVIPGNPNRFIGERLRDTGDQIIGTWLGQGGPEKFHRYSEHLRYLSGGGTQGGETGRGYQPRQRPQKKAPLIADKVPLAQKPDLGAGDRQFLLRLPEGAVCRGLSRFHLPAGKAGLAALTDPGRSDLKQQVQSIRTLYQRTQNSIFVPGFQQRGNMIAVKPAQICQFFSHSSIVKAR